MGWEGSTATVHVSKDGNEGHPGVLRWRACSGKARTTLGFHSPYCWYSVQYAFATSAVDQSWQCKMSGWRPLRSKNSKAACTEHSNESELAAQGRGPGMPAGWLSRRGTLQKKSKRMPSSSPWYTPPLNMLLRGSMKKHRSLQASSSTGWHQVSSCQSERGGMQISTDSSRPHAQRATHPSTMHVETKILVPPQSNSVSYCVPPSSGDWRKKSYLQRCGTCSAG